MAINKPLNVNEYILQFPQETKKNNAGNQNFD